MEFIPTAQMHMWFSIAVTVITIFMFSWEKLSIELNSLLLIAVLLAFGTLFPYPGPEGSNLLGADEMLAGFANPALFTVLALLVIGQGILQVQALNPLIRLINFSPPRYAYLSFFAVLACITLFSGILNNTPLVILAIPILQAVATNMGRSSSRVMIPLSYAAILGGMTTLIGSSTNLLVSDSMKQLGMEGFSFFEFTHIGFMLAGVGFIYVIFILPKLLPHKISLAASFFGETRQFVAEIDIMPGSKLIGEPCVGGQFKSLQDLDVRMIHRAGNTILPPFENYTIHPNDVLIVSATREALIDTLTRLPGFILSSNRAEKEQMMSTESEESDMKALDEAAAASHPESHSRVLAEVMIAPGARLIDRSLEQINFYKQYGCVVLGVQRHARMMRRRLYACKAVIHSLFLAPLMRSNHSGTIVILSYWPAAHVTCRPGKKRRWRSLFLAWLWDWPPLD